MMYKTKLTLKETEKAIKITKDYFEKSLSESLNLERVTAPLMVECGKGINDNLNGVEKPVSFQVKSLNNNVEIVQSLAKWKRLKIHSLNTSPDSGIYTDMNAIRPDETLDYLHSLYVDQWDWEKRISKTERNILCLKKEVTKIYEALLKTENYISELFPKLEKRLPRDIYFIQSEDLLQKYPSLSSKERENKICSIHKVVFVIGIGGKLSNGLSHDSRSPDYDDWSTETEPGYYGLNGDLLIWSDIHQHAIELSSMGIRVCSEGMQRQLRIAEKESWRELHYHKLIIDETLPQTIGGGIGQSRLCLLLLQKYHIGEVQAGVWSEQTKEECIKNNIKLL
jgi:aspartate--ammonia ligase